MLRKTDYWQRALLLTLLYFSSTGCDNTAEVEVKPPTIFDSQVVVPRVQSTAGREKPDESFPTNSQAWSEKVGLPWQVGYAQYLNGKRIGFSVVKVKASTVAKDQVVITRHDVIENRRDGKVVPVEIRLDAIERIGGRLGNFTLATSSGDSERNVEGMLLDQRLKLTITSSSGEKTQQSIAYGEGTWGLLGVQAMLLHTPMQAGERRIATAFVPGLNQVANVELTAGKFEPTPLVGGTTPELLPIEVDLRTENSRLRARNWVNALGEIEKTLTLSGPSIVTFRVPIEATERIASEIQLAQWQDKTIQLVGDFSEAAVRGHVVYHIDASDVDPYLLFAKTSRQSVLSVDPRKCDVTVSEDNDFPPANEAEQPVEADLQSSNLVPSDHEMIAALATEICEGEENPEAIGAKLTSGAFERVKATQWNPKIANAVETARRLEGDSIARAVLLTALLRNRDIPARLATGIRLANTTQDTFVIHAWTEAWLNERWVPLDPSSESPVGLGYLRMQSSALDEPDSYNAVISAFKNAQYLEAIRIVEAD